MPTFIVHFADAERLTIQSGGPNAARKLAAKRRPGIDITKIKIDRSVHTAGPKGRLSMAPRPTR